MATMNKNRMTDASERGSVTRSSRACNQFSRSQPEFSHHGAAAHRAALLWLRLRRAWSFVLAGLVVVAASGCGQQPATQVARPEPTVTFKPQEMADALHAVIAADQKTYAMQCADENLMAQHAQRLRQASESIQQNGAEFHYVLRSLQPINPKHAPQTDTEKAGLQFVLDHPGTNYYGKESLGGRRYFTAVYSDVATANACADCHNRNPGSPKKDFKPGDIMGGMVVRVPLEF